MNPSPDSRSLHRRLRFAGNARLLADRLANAVGLPVVGAAPVQRVPEKLASLAFDLVESCRARALVPSPGEPREAIAPAELPVPQHPRYRGFWHDRGRHAMVGLHLGLDLIGEGGRYQLIEVNQNAAIPPERRALYGAVDPDIERILDLARRRGFERVVPFRDAWTEAQVDEWERCGAEWGIPTTPWAFPQRARRPRHPAIALPDPLPEGTLVILYTTTHSPVDHWVHDKFTSSLWLREELSDCKGVQPVQTAEELSVPPLDDDPRWPNLVVKLSGWDLSRFVYVARVRSEAEARAAFRIDANGWPGILARSLGSRFMNLLTDRDRVLYQPYVKPPTLDGRPFKIRSHVLVTPVETAFLSTRRVVAGKRPPQALPFGLVEDRAPYVVGFSAGGSYQRADAAEEGHLRGAGEEVARALERTLSARFETGPA